MRPSIIEQPASQPDMILIMGVSSDPHHPVANHAVSTDHRDRTQPAQVMGIISRVVRIGQSLARSLGDLEHIHRPLPTKMRTHGRGEPSTTQRTQRPTVMNHPRRQQVAHFVAAGQRKHRSTARRGAHLTQIPISHLGAAGRVERPRIPPGFSGVRPRADQNYGTAGGRCRRQAHQRGTTRNHEEPREKSATTPLDEKMSSTYNCARCTIEQVGVPKLVRVRPGRRPVPSRICSIT